MDQGTVMSAVNSPVSASPFASIESAIEDFRAGKMVVIVDSEDRENEGDVCVAAEFVTPEIINFMATHARGLICMTMGPEKCDTLGLDLMAPRNGTPYDTAFTVSIEAAEGVSTGISAADRSHTIKVAAMPNAVAGDLTRPGHVFPLRARPNGVLERTGQTEGSVDLSKLAGLEPAAVICEIMNADGTMARVSDLTEFCSTHDMKMISITDMIEYRKRTEMLVERSVSAELPTRFGNFRALGYVSKVDGKQHLALVRGDVENTKGALVRVHSECATGDVFGSLRCDCGEQLEASMRAIDEAGNGVLLYLAQEGRGIGLLNKLKAYELQEEGRDTVDANLELGFDADTREYDAAAQMLRDLGLSDVRMLTNNPRKIDALERYGVSVQERVSLETEPHDGNRSYLRTKRDRLGHLLSHAGLGSIVREPAEKRLIHSH
jgi:3,4-dihydroxy 2-butanone 4-phosphate synthase / GTP cyclohydrolase II